MLYDEFKPIVDKVLNNWTALQLAVEHGMGAPGGEKTAQLMSVYIARYCVENVVCVEDLTETLEDLMDEEFDTVCHDNSPAEIARCLTQYLTLLKEGRHSEVQEMLASMPPCQRWLSQPYHILSDVPPQSGGNPDDDTSSSDDDGAQSRQPSNTVQDVSRLGQQNEFPEQNGANGVSPKGSDNAQASSSQDEPMDEDEPAEPSWTVVRSRKKN